jgi:hypothetical protein
VLSQLSDSACPSVRLIPWAAAACLLLFTSCAQPGEGRKDASAPVAEKEADPAAEAAEAQTGEEAGAPEAPLDIFHGDAPDIPLYVPAGVDRDASLAEWNDILEAESTERILAEGQILWGKTKIRVKEMLRFGEGVKRVLFICDLRAGDRTIKAQLKVSQQNYHEWKSELHAYTLGRRIGLALPPVVMRPLSRKEMQRLAARMTPEDFELITWSGTNAGFAKASLRYWVETLSPRTVGGTLADEAYMMAIAQSLHPANREAILADVPVYLDVGRAFVFDYLIYNNDRARNLGTISLPDGSDRLILFDHGLAFGVEGKEKKSAITYVEAMQMMPSDVIDHLRSLTEPELQSLVGTGAPAGTGLSDKIVSQIWERRAVILKKTDDLMAVYGPLALY